MTRTAEIGVQKAANKQQSFIVTEAYLRTYKQISED